MTADPAVDEVWAYRARGVDPLVPVRVMRHGTQKPARVRIRFEGEDAEGHEEWVPPARLKVPWADVETFIAREQRWDAVRSPGPQNDDAEAMAAETLFDLLVPLEVASESSWGRHPDP